MEHLPVYDANGKLLDLPPNIRHLKSDCENKILQAMIDEINRLKDKVKRLEQETEVNKGATLESR